jgi:hypothetical protein
LKEQVKIIWSQVRSVWGMLQCFHVALCYEILGQNHLVFWSIVMREKPTVISPFFEAFPSDHIPKATKYVCTFVSSQ